MSRPLEIIIFKFLVFVACAFGFTAFILLMFAGMDLAARFAFWGDKPPFPWPMVCFFWFIGWLISFGIGLFAKDDPA